MSKTAETPPAPEQKQLKDFTIDQLKSIAYDQIVLLQTTQNNLQLINQELASRSKPTP